METSQFTVLLEKYRKAIEAYTKEFDSIMRNPLTKSTIELQAKWSIVFNTLRETISEYKGTLFAAVALGIPIEEDDKQLIAFDKRGVKVDETGTVVYDQTIISEALNVMQKQTGMSNSSTIGMATPPENKSDGGIILPN